MKRFYTFLLSLLVLPISMIAQGWPANYGGVMLQGFYWDSYSETTWTKLTEQSDTLSKYFDLIWVPNSGTTSSYYHNNSTTSMGYDPCFWLAHNSCWGTEGSLRNMISTFKSKGTGIIEDVVINHKNGLTGWRDFPYESVTGTNTAKTYTLTWDNTNYSGICKNDECNSNGYITTGNDDTGDNFDGYRDLDHTNSTVQTNVKTYLDFLLNELGYAGFRYDMVKGYSSCYTGIYNSASNPTYSVGEYWDSSYGNTVGWMNGTKVNGVIQSAAFDFPLKYSINNVFNNKTWSGLVNKGIAGDNGMSRYAVTFVDNHDTYRNSGDKVNNNVLAANAFILAMPGTPCLFWPHWTAYQSELKKMIAARKAAGVNNQSIITYQQEYGGGYVTIVSGSKKRIMVHSGYVSGYDTDRFKAVSVGTSENPNYAYYISYNDMTYHPNYLTAYFEAPSSWTNVKCWAWNESTNFTGGSWPGALCTRVGTAGNGNAIWRWDGGEISNNNSPSKIIFNNGNSGDGNQSYEMSFTNGGYYNYTAQTMTMNPTMSSTGYDRIFTADRTSTVCLPFALSESDVASLAGKLYKMTGYADGVIHFTKVSSTEAYKPYLFLANAGGKSFNEYRWTAIENGSVAVDEINGMHFSGTMERKNLVSNSNTTYFGYKESDGSFIQAGTTNGVNVSSYRCYFYTSIAGAKLNSIVLDDSTTGISAPVSINTDNGIVYGVDGRVVGTAGSNAKLDKGIYIVKGKKVIISK